VSLSSAAIINALAAGKPGRGCFNGVDPALIKDIRQHPADYYVNIHDTAHPNGAARGQLHK